MVFCHSCLIHDDSDCLVTPVIKVGNTTANIPTATTITEILL